MIPKEGEIYHIDFNCSDYPEHTHYTGPGIYLGKHDAKAGLYEFKLPEEVYVAWFEEKYIVRRIASPVESIQEAKEKIKYLKSLLYECMYYVEEAKFFRICHEGPHERLDREAEELYKTIEEEFTEEELEEETRALNKKYACPTTITQ